jgi:hypothetical protein
VVGSPPSGRARWRPSRHLRCSLEHERGLRRASQRRWRVRHRDLGDALGDFAARRLGRHCRRRKQRTTANGRQPAPERAPSWRRCHAPRAHHLANRRGALGAQPEQTERQCDRRARVVPPRLDLARHDGDHRPAAHAQVPANQHDLDRWRRIAGGRPSKLPLAQPVADETQRTTGLACSTAASRTTAGPHLVDRRRLLQPELALQLGMNDFDWAPAARRQTCNWSLTGVLPTPPSPFSASAGTVPRLHLRNRRRCHR